MRDNSDLTANELGTILDALGELSDDYTERVNRLVENGHHEESRRVIRYKEEITELERLIAKVGNIVEDRF